MQFDLSKLRINRIYSVTTIYTTAGDTLKRRLRPSWAIIYKWEGETLYTYGDGKVLISNSQNSVILPKGSSYMWKCTKEGRYSIIEFDSDMECEEIFGFHITDGNKLLSYFKKLERARILQLPYYKIEELSGAYRILHTFLINAPTLYMYNSTYKCYTINDFERFLNNDNPFKEFMVLAKDRKKIYKFNHPYFEDVERQI